jgi:hypothetical protein
MGREKRSIFRAVGTKNQRYRCIFYTKIRNFLEKYQVFLNGIRPMLLIILEKGNYLMMSGFIKMRTFQIQKISSRSLMMKNRNGYYLMDL